MGSSPKRRRTFCSVSLIAMLAAAAASAQTSGTQTEKPPPAAETAPARPPATPLPAVAQIGPAREIKLAENTWFRFGAQIQAWFRALQDPIKQPDGSDGGYAFDFFCRRCRFFSTGSVVKDIYFNVLFEAGNTGRADPATGAKTATTAVLLDAYGQVKFADAFWLSGGQILLPLTRNGMQPTTTFVSLDVSNAAQTPILQGNSFVLRDLGIQANGFFVNNHLEYRVGLFQGSRQPGTTTQLASHNGPRLVTSLALNFWDPETGYVNGGHYYGTRRVLGVQANFDYQQFRKAGPATTPFAVTAGANVDKNAYYGFSGAAFINLPLAGTPNPRGGDEIVGLLQFGYYDGGLRGAITAPTNFGTYPLILKQTNYLAEAGYYNQAGHFSVFGKWEKRKISEDYPLAFRQAIATGAAPAPSQSWYAAGLKYYVAPANFMNFTLQYERVQNDDAPGTAQSGTNNITFQMQTILY